MGWYKQDMLMRAEKGEMTMECPNCGCQLIVDQYEDADIVYCKCGYQQMEEAMCDEQEEAYLESLGNNGEVHPALINEDDWRKER